MAPPAKPLSLAASATLPQVGIKDKLLQQQHTQHQANIAERDQLRVELGRWGHSSDAILHDA